MSQTRRWGIGAAIAALVILAAGWFLLVKPQKAKVSDLNDQASAQEQANQTLLTKITALQAEAKNNAQEQRLLEKFATQIPDTAAEPSLIRTLTETAKGSGVDLVTITPGDAGTIGVAAASGSQSLGAAAPSAGTLYKLPIALTITGSYSNVESFFAGLEHLSRSFLIDNFKLVPATGTSASGKTLAANALTAQISTAVFYSTPSAAAVAAAQSPAPASAPAATGGTSAPAASSSNPAAPAADVARNAAGETS